MLTIRQLIDSFPAATRLVAGPSGCSRLVKAANVCVEREPWRWLSPEELLMMPSNGLPTDDRGQQLLVQLLNSHGMAGLVVSDPEGRPVFAEEVLATADRLGFPLLQITWDVPFAVVAGVVAEHAHEGLGRVMDVYETFNDDARSRANLTDEVSEILGVRIDLVDDHTGSSLMTRAPAAPEVCRNREAYRKVAWGTLARLDGHDYLVFPLLREVCLWVPAGQNVLDSRSLKYLCSFLMTELKRTWRGRDEESDALREAMIDYLDGRIDSEAMMSSLARRGLGQSPWRMIDSQPDETAEILYMLDKAGLPRLSLGYSGGASILVGGPGLEDSLAAMEKDRRIFSSEPFRALESLAEAAQSAAWRRRLSLGDSRSNILSALVPQALSDAKRLVDAVLGPLLQYDKGHRSDLVLSAEAFLDSNRSWESASTKLHVHRQTLRYRLGRVTELTGLRLDSMDDLVELHVALKVQRMLESTPVVFARPQIAKKDDQSYCRRADHKSSSSGRTSNRAKTATVAAMTLK